MKQDEHEITELLRSLSAGERGSLDELRRLARGQRRRWRGEETLNTTALIHEAYLKLTAEASSG